MNSSPCFKCGVKLANHARSRDKDGSECFKFGCATSNESSCDYPTTEDRVSKSRWELFINHNSICKYKGFITRIVNQDEIKCIILKNDMDEVGKSVCGFGVCICRFKN